MQTANEKRMKSTILSLAAFFCATTAFAAESYQSLNEIKIGGEGGWDILTIDSSANRLYLSHATKVVVVDLEKNKVVGEIADTPEFTRSSLFPNLGADFLPTERKTNRALSI